MPDQDLSIMGFQNIQEMIATTSWKDVNYTSRKQGFGWGLASPLVPVQSRTGTHEGHTSRFVRPGGRPGLVGHWSGFSGPICPGSRHKPGPIVLAPSPQPLVPVRGSNRDRRGSFSPVSSHEPGQMSCIYIPHHRGRALHGALFFAGR